jgi:hypothetical protein
MDSRFAGPEGGKRIGFGHELALSALNILFIAESPPALLRAPSGEPKATEMPSLRP